MKNFLIATGTLLTILMISVGLTPHKAEAYSYYGTPSASGPCYYWGYDGTCYNYSTYNNYSYPYYGNTYGNYGTSYSNYYPNSYNYASVSTHPYDYRYRYSNYNRNSSRNRNRNYYNYPSNYGGSNYYNSYNSGYYSW